MIILNGGSYYPDSQAIDINWINNIDKDEIIGFIPSATLRSEKEYFDFFVQKMSNYGLSRIILIDLYGDWSNAKLAKVYYFGGGNTYKLLDIMRKSGFADFIKKIHKDKIVIGNSAGAVVLGNDIRSSNDQDIIGLSNTIGLGLVDYSICPHYDIEKQNRLMQLSNQLNIKVVGIPEQSGIIVKEDKEDVIGDIMVFEPKI